MIIVTMNLNYNQFFSTKNYIQVIRNRLQVFDGMGTVGKLYSNRKEAHEVEFIALKANE